MFNLYNLIRYQNLSIFRVISIFGVFLFFTILNQIISGIMVSFSLINDSMLVVISRNFEDQEDLYTDDFFWLHERGVDFLFIYIYIHILRKIYIKTNTLNQEIAWKNGSILFLLVHCIVFFGLVLCCTHLSDVTLKIASKLIATLTFKYGSFGYWLFTDQTLNTDTIIRLMYLHYILPFLLLLLSVSHMITMHYGWKDMNIFQSKRVCFFWLGEVLKTEIFLYFLCITIISCYVSCTFHDNEALAYELFMWGDLGMITDIRFLGVSPHWYFRAYMGWLIFCPHHYIGIFGLIYYMLSFYFQYELTVLYKLFNELHYLKYSFEQSLLYITIFNLFFISFMYTTSYLPYGRFFTSIGGNSATTLSYLFIFIYLTIPVITLVYNYIQQSVLNIFIRVC